MLDVNKTIYAQNVCFSNETPLSFILGPCQMESKDHAFFMAEALKKMSLRLNFSFVYKSSFDKANRTSLKGKRGIGLDESLKIFLDLKKEFNIPLLTDVHSEEQCSLVGEVVDILQIPAFLSRQTDLLVAAAKTGRIVNIKKGQFLAPWDMKHVIEKISQSGNKNVLCCERGTTFGYNRLICDMCSLPIMASFGTPVIFDATHSVQQPGGQGDKSGGERRFVEILAKAAVATRIAGIFLETHEDPDSAPSDGPNMVPLNNLESLLKKLIMIDQLIKAF